MGFRESAASQHIDFYQVKETYNCHALQGHTASVTGVPRTHQSQFGDVLMAIHLCPDVKAKRYSIASQSQ